MIRDNVLLWVHANDGNLLNAGLAAAAIVDNFQSNDDQRLAWAIWNTPPSQQAQVAIAFHHAECWESHKAMCFQPTMEEYDSSSDDSNNESYGHLPD